MSAIFKYLRGVSGNFSLVIFPLVMVSLLIVLAIALKYWIGISNQYLYTLIVSFICAAVFAFSFFFEEIPTSKIRRNRRSNAISILTVAIPAAIILDVVPMLIQWLRSRDILTDSVNWNSILSYLCTFVLIYGSSVMIALRAFANAPVRYRFMVRMLVFLISWLVVLSLVIWLVNRIYYGIPPTGFALLFPFTIAFAIPFVILYRRMGKVRSQAVIALFVSLVPLTLLIWVAMVPYSLYIVRCTKQIGELTRPITNITLAFSEDKESLSKNLRSHSFATLTALADKRERLTSVNPLTWKEHHDSDYSSLTKTLERLSLYFRKTPDSDVLSISAKTDELQDYSVFTTIRPKYYTAAMRYLEEFGNVSRMNQVDKQFLRDSQSLFAMNRMVRQSRSIYNQSPRCFPEEKSIADFDRRARRSMVLGMLVGRFYTKNGKKPFDLDRDFLSGLCLKANDLKPSCSKDELSIWISQNLLKKSDFKDGSIQYISIDLPNKRPWIQRCLDKNSTDQGTATDLGHQQALANMYTRPGNLSEKSTDLTYDSDLIIEAFIELLAVLSVRECNEDDTLYFNVATSESVKALLSKIRTVECIGKIVHKPGLASFPFRRDIQVDWDSLVSKPGSNIAAHIVKMHDLQQCQESGIPGIANHIHVIDEIMFDNIGFALSDQSSTDFASVADFDDNGRFAFRQMCEFILSHRAVGGIWEEDPYEGETVRLLRELLSPTIPNSKQFTTTNVHMNERAMILLQRMYSDQKAFSIEGRERFVFFLLCDAFTAKAERVVRRLYCGEHSDLIDTHKLVDRLAVSMLGPNLLTVVCPAFAIFILGAVFVNPNLTSLHHFYKDSLVQAFFMDPKCGHNRESSGSDFLDVKMSQCCNHEQGSSAPYLIVNATLNVQGTVDEGLRERNAYLFEFTPLYLGSVLGSLCPVGSPRGRDVFMRMKDYEKFDPSFSLGTAMTVSAGAAAPNMGRYSSWMYRLALLFSNIRLGYWIWNLERVAAQNSMRFETSRLDRVIEDEKRSIVKRRVNACLDSQKESAFGLAFSGGGIRSAAFNLGVAQSCKRSDLWRYFDYLSTVSGGGYVGCSISLLMSNANTTVSEASSETTIESSVACDHHSPIQSEFALGDYENSEHSSPGFSIFEDRQADCSRFQSADNPKQSFNNLSSLRRWFFDHKFSCVFSEAFALMDTSHGWWNLSDGGHLENLGVYSLLLRRCKVIVVGDGEDDYIGIFDGLTRLLLLAQNDLGINIEFAEGEIDRLRVLDGVTTSHFTVAKISYPADHKRNLTEDIGWLLYLRASVTGDEDPIISNYRRGKSRERFPNETTADQFFDEHQFEAYRRLGLHIGDVALKSLFGDEGLDSQRDMTHELPKFLEKYFGGLVGPQKFKVLVTRLYSDS